MSTQIAWITPAELHQAQLKSRYIGLLDVRTPAEFRAGHIAGAQLLPIEDLKAQAVAERFKRPGLGQDETLYVICQTGPRAEQAVERLRAAGFANIAALEGGMQGWEKARLPMRRCGNAIALERQVQIAVGTLLVLKVFLGFTVSELFFVLTAFIGAGLVMAGVTRWCGMATLIARMPWNRRTDCAEQAAS